MYGKDFEPVVEIDQNLAVLTETGWQYFVVGYIEPLPPSEDFIKDFGLLADDGTATDEEITLVEMKTNELGQFRFEPLDEINIKVAQPSAASRFSIKNKHVRVTRLSALRDTTLKHTECFVFEGDNIYFPEVKNESGASLAKTRVQFYGYRFVLKEWLEAAEYNKSKLNEMIENIDKRITGLRSSSGAVGREVKYQERLFDKLNKDLLELDVELLWKKPKRATYVVATGKTGAD